MHNMVIVLQVFSWSPLCSLMWRTTCSSLKRSPLAPLWWCPNSKMGKSRARTILMYCCHVTWVANHPVLFLQTPAMWTACCREPMTQSMAWPQASSPATLTRPCTWASGWRPEPCLSTPTTRPTWLHLLGVSSSQASGKTLVSGNLPFYRYLTRDFASGVMDRRARQLKRLYRHWDKWLVADFTHKGQFTLHKVFIKVMASHLALEMLMAC